MEIVEWFECSLKQANGGTFVAIQVAVGVEP